MQESTEDAQKFADVAALEQPYMEIGFTTSASAPFVAPLGRCHGLDYLLQRGLEGHFALACSLA